MKRKLQVKGIYGKEYLLLKLIFKIKRQCNELEKGNFIILFFYCVWEGEGRVCIRLRTRSRSIMTRNGH